MTLKRASASSRRSSGSAPICTVACVENDSGRSRVRFQATSSRSSSRVKVRWIKKLSSEKNTVSAPAACAAFTSHRICGMDLLRNLRPTSRTTSQKSQLLGHPRQVCTEK